MYGFLCVVYSFFFFQAEDGIRDGTVTGVQTCALPICRDRARGAACGSGRPGSRRPRTARRSEEHTSELQSQFHLVCRLLLEKKKKKKQKQKVPKYDLQTTHERDQDKY